MLHQQIVMEGLVLNGVIERMMLKSMVRICFNMIWDQLVVVLNPVSPQSGNWSPDRAGWCPGMAVPVRIDDFASSMSGASFNFEYDYEDVDI